MKKTFYITYKIEARFITAVEAESLEEAMKAAEGQYCDADFGEAEDIEGEAIIAEDQDGNFIWEK